VCPSCLSAGAPRKLSIRGENAYTTIFEWYRDSSGPEMLELHDYDKEPLIVVQSQVRELAIDPDYDNE